MGWSNGRLGLTLAVLAGLLVGCTPNGGLASKVPGEPAQIVGVVRSLGEPTGVVIQGQGAVSTRLLRFLVEEEEKLPTGEPGLIWVTVGEKSLLLVETDGKRRAASLSEIQPGKRVQVWHEGMILTSYPAQAGGHVVIIQE